MTAQPKRVIGEDFDWLDGLISRAIDHAELLSDNEIRFVDDMRRRADRFGASTFVTEAQRTWLESIERRINEAEAER